MARKLIVEVFLDAAAYSRQIKQVEGKTTGLARNLEKAGRGTAVATVGFRGLGRAAAFASGWFIGGASIGAGIKTSFDEMFKAQKVSAQTAATLKSTGEAAGVTADQVDTLAQSLANLSGVSATTIHTAENVLLTFTHIHKDAFAPATKAALDMSVALGIDLQSAASRVGKALQDPVRGMNLLRRSGVSFTAQQQTLIRTLVSSGQTFEAQRIILSRLRGEFGGSAKAAGQTLPGQLNILKNHIIDLGVAIAKVLNPALDDLAKKTNKVFEKKPGGAAGGGGGPGDFAQGARLAGGALKGLRPVLDGATHAAGALAFGFVALGHIYNRLFAGDVRVRAVQFKSALDQLTAGMEKNQKVASKYVDLRTAGGIVIPSNVRPIDITGPSAQQRNTWFDARIARQLDRVQDLSLRRQLAQLKVIASEIAARRDATKDATRRLTLQDQYVAVLRQERSVQADINDQEKQRTDQLKEQAKLAKQALRDRADAIKQATLDRLSRQQTAVQNSRALSDALTGLRTARLIGGPGGIRQALRNVQDVRFDITRARLENAPFSLSRAGVLSVGNQITINVHGVTNPDEVAKRVVAVIERRGRHTTKQQRGPTAGAAGPR